MLTQTRPIEIVSRDYWFKIVGFLQQHWALVDQAPDQDGCRVHFLGDSTGVFDGLAFPTAAAAAAALERNGFARLSGDPKAQGFLPAPPPPFLEGSHPNGRIYSSGRCWR